MSPTCFTAEALEDSPPMAPMLPSTSIVPVTATLPPPINEPGVNASSRVRANAVPAEGPPMCEVLMSTLMLSGRCTWRVSAGMKPMIVRPGVSGDSIVVMSTVCSLPSRRKVTAIVSPGLCVFMIGVRSPSTLTGVPSSAVIWSRGCSTAAAGALRAHSPPGSSRRRHRSEMIAGPSSRLVPGMPAREKATYSAASLASRIIW